MTQPNYLKDILKSLGWNDGFQIPVADDENKALEAEVARLTLARLKAKTDCENATQKYEALERHMKFITQESEQIQKLLSTHKKQLDTENHYLRTSEAEKTRLLNDIRDTIKEEKEIRQKNNEKKAEIKRGMEKIEKIKKETFWDEEALKAWEQSLNKRDEDNNLLIKFSKEDEKNFLELEAKRASLQMEYLQREKTVAKMVNDLSNYESVIERTGKTIQLQLAERDALVVQWKETVKILHQRDDAISLQEDKLLETMEMIQKNQEILKNEESLLNIEKNNNKELERENEDLSAQYSRHQRNLDNVYQYVLLLNSEVNGIKRQVTKTANNLENERCKFKTLNKEIENKTNEIENVEKKLLKLMEKYENLKVVNMNVGERCKQLEKLIDYETKQHAVYMTDSNRLNSGVFRVQSKLTEQMDITVTRELDIVNMTTLIDTLQKMNKEVQTEVDKKKELIYNMEFKIDQMEDKQSEMEKQNVTEDNAEVYNKLKDLEKILADHVETKTLLQDQISRIQDEMRRLTTAIANDEQKLDVMQNKLQNEKLEYEGGMKQAEAAKHAAQEKQVEENILILKLKQFDQSMKKEETEIYNLQRMKINLMQAMRERELEVNSKKELLQVQKRNLDEDKGRLKSDLKNRHLKVDQLQSKYHLATMCLGTDEDGQTLTITHYKLKAAQDKYYLKQRGDTLDEKIRTIEKEIVAMENTLKIVNLTNSAFKKSMSEVEDSGIVTTYVWK
ncbi:hypothetical protein WA026_006712 [Henosepilachna vigintioctopunctata]|uniref:Coiled-coil domain-containing protein 39 n=1 Tax=Henosepilachna vigintioctopunctata TaxID=420089 RepID=A0AAW1UHH9_9CUCU